MDLWIRSQNKTKLLKVDNFEAKTTPGGHCIFVYSGNKEYCVGNYKSFDRMIAIIDKIQELLDTFEPKNMCKMMVYEMPEE